MAFVVGTVFPAASLAGANPYTLGGPKAEASAWPNGTQGATFSGGAGSIVATLPLTRPTATRKPTVTYKWNLPASIPADGGKGSLTIFATAGDQDVFAPGFSINGVLVGCEGIVNTPSYGTGCADGDHAAVGVSLQPGQSRSVTQDFVVKPGVGTLTVVIAGYPQQFLYTSSGSAGSSGSSATASSSAGSASSAFAQVHYTIDATLSQYEYGNKVQALIVRGSGSFEAEKDKPNFVRGNQGKGSAEIVIHETSGRQVIA
ncbi:MAG: hypothetical protein JO175_10920, partial [Candidatus Eremiobacteraeota bacterium]|nr:hypothetical protein [Candidatus Eremiobacteraeota bacterium]